MCPLLTPRPRLHWAFRFARPTARESDHDDQHQHHTAGDGVGDTGNPLGGCLLIIIIIVLLVVAGGWYGRGRWF
jgi:hypothetical protein